MTAFLVYAGRNSGTLWQPTSGSDYIGVAVDDVEQLLDLFLAAEKPIMVVYAPPGTETERRLLHPDLKALLNLRPSC